LPIFFFALIRSTHILIAVVFITAFSTAAKAEDDSTSVSADTDTSRIKIYNCLELNGPYKITWQYDYEITGLQQYRSTNNLLRTFAPNVFTSGINNLRLPSILADLGTIGSPAKSMIYQPNIRPGLDYGFHSFDHYKLNPEHTLFYNLRTPLTEIYYQVGAKEEQSISVLHAQNVNELVNVGIVYQRGGTEGFYTRQQGDYVNFKAFTSIDSKNERYHLNAQAIWNELNKDQSGGIAADSLFEDSVIRKDNIPVNLASASSSENEQVYRLNQSFDFGKTEEIHVNDSTTGTDFTGKLRIYHTSAYDKGAVYFWDSSPDTGYYPAIYHDSLLTDNHVHRRKFTNTLGVVTLDLDPGNRNKLNAGIAGMHEYIIYNRYRKDTITYNAIVKGFFGNSAYANFHWNISGDYAVEGINAKDYRWELKLKYTNKKKTQYLDYLLSVQQRAPSMIHYFYEGNHYRWKNNFEKQHNATTYLQYTFVNHGARIGLRADAIGQYVYYDKEGLPRQELDEINILSAYVMKDFNWKRFSIKNRLQYQVVSDSAVMRLPKLIASHSAFYHNYLFKKALYMQIGFDVLFNTSYYADAYAPSTQQFYLQSEKMIGNYPYLDFFVNFKINQAKFFVKAAHINQGWLLNRYYAVPHYPRNDLAFIGGVSWRFLD